MTSELHGKENPQIPSPLPAVEKESLLKWAGRKTLSGAAKLVALPMDLFGKTVQTTGTLCSKTPVTIALTAGAGACYVTAWTVDTVLKAPAYLFETGAVSATMSVLDPLSKEVLGTATEKGIQAREAEGERVQQAGSYAEWALKAVKVVAAGVPGVGSVTTALSETVAFGKNLEEKAREAEKDHLSTVGKGITWVVSLVNKTVPAFFWGAGKVLQVPQKMPVIGSAALKERSYALWTNPQAPGQFLQNIGDRIVSWSSRIYHCFEEVHAPTSPSSPQKAIDFDKEVKEVEPGEVEKFNQAVDQEGEEFLEDLLYMIDHAKGYHIPTEKKQRYAHALKKGAPLPEAIIKELIVLKKYLPDNMLTPRLFQKCDELLQLKIFEVVHKYSTLSPSERKFLLSSEFRHLQVKGDFAKISDTNRIKLEKLLCEKFNALSPKDKDRCLNISVEQFRQLEPTAQKKLLEIVSDKLKKMGRKAEPSEKTRIEQLKKLQTLEAAHDIASLLAIFNRLHPGKEKLEVFSELQTAVIVFAITPQQIAEEIVQLEQKLEQVANASERAKIEKMLLWLREQAELMDAAEPASREKAPATDRSQATPSDKVNLRRIDEQIGLQVGAGETVGEYAGAIPHRLLTKLGLVPWAISTGIGYALKPERVKTAFSGVATAADIALMLPWVPNYLISTLGQLGLPVDTIEKMLQLAPALAFKLGLATMAKASSITPYIGAFVGDVQSYVGGLNAPATLQRLETASQMMTPRVPFLENRITEYLQEACKCTVNTPPKDLFVCNPEVFDTLTKPGFFEAMAKELNLPPESPAFYKSLMDKLQRGEVARPEMPMTSEQVAATTSFVTEVLQQSYTSAIDIGTKAKESLYGTLSFIYANTIAGTRYEPVVEMAKEMVVDPLKKKVADAASTTATMFSEAASEAQHGMARAFGTEQKIPKELESLLQALSQQYGLMAEGAALANTALLSLTSMQELDKQWYGMIVRLAANSPEFVSLLQQYKMTSESTNSLLTAVFENLHRLGVGSQAFLEKQLSSTDIEIFGKEQFESVFSMIQKQLEGSLDKDSTALKSGLALLGGGATLFQLFSSSYTLIPIVLRHTLPPILRTTGNFAAQYGQNCFYGIAEKSYNALDATGAWFEKMGKTAGGKAQFAWNYLVAGRYVSPKRIDNFLDLTPEEKQHLVEIALSSRNISPEDKKILQQATPVHFKEKPQQRKIAECAIRTYDRLATDEKLSISHQFFSLQESAKQEKIIDIVEKRVGLTEIERKDSRAIVDKFNSLPEKYKKEVDDFSIWEYGQLTESQQNSILFQIACSKAYLDAKGPPQSPHLDMVEDNNKWQLKQIEELKQIPNRELEKLLVLYAQVTPSERSILTPSTLRDFSPARIRHHIALVQAYNADILQQIKEIKGPQYDLKNLENAPSPSKQRDELLEVLAFACNKIRPHQQHYLLQFTEEEFKESGKEEQIALISFLFAQPLKAEQTAFLKEQLVQPTKSKQIVAIFNALPASVQADFRQETKNFVDSQKETIKTARAHLEQSAVKLELVNKRIAQQSGKMSGIQLRIDNRKEMLKTETNSAKITKLKKQIAEEEKKLLSTAGLIANFKKSQREVVKELDALNSLLPEEEQKEYKTSALPPEWLDFIDNATALTSKGFANLYYESLIKMLEKAENAIKFDQEVKRAIAQTETMMGLAKNHQTEALKRASEFEEQAKKEEDPAKKILLQFKASFAAEFYVQLNEQYIAALKPLLKKYQDEADALYKKKFPTAPTKRNF